ncbi:MAG: TerB family tellurite resistance protein [Deltaproteobacteria bacterium]|nr:TerB family tellurite resistance protein [Deltaproteobacteria bacterium]
MDTKDKIVICKVVAQAILSDAAITDEEHAFLDKLMDSYGLDKTQRKEVLHRNLGDDTTEMAREVGDAEARKTLLAELAKAVAVDGVFAAAEEELLGRVGEALGVSADEIDKLIGDAVA